MMELISEQQRTMPSEQRKRGVVVYSGQQIEGYGNMLLIRHARTDT
jgi:hypothetical protein